MDKIRADTRDGKNLLHHKGSHQDGHDLHTQGGDHGDDGVADLVAPNDPGRGEALGLRGLDVILRNDLQHQRAHIAGFPGDGTDGQGQCGQDGIGKALPLGHREPPQPGGKYILQQRGQNKHWHRHAQHGEAHQSIVQGTAPLPGSNDAEKDPNGEAEQIGLQPQLRRHRESLGNDVVDRLAHIFQRVAEITPDQVGQKGQILLQGRAVQPVVGHHIVPHLLAHQLRGTEGGPRQGMKQEEATCGNEPDGDERDHQPLENISFQGGAPFEERYAGRRGLKSRRAPRCAKLLLLFTCVPPDC